MPKHQSQGASPIDPQLKQQLTVTYTYMGVAMSYLVVFAPLFLFYYHKYWLGAIHAFDVIVIIALFSHVYRTKTVRLAVTGLCSIAIFTLTLLAIEGGVDASGIYFALPGSIFIFFLNDRRRSIRWVSAMFIPLTIALGLDALGVISLPYHSLNFLMFLFSYLLSVTLLFLYATEKDKLDARLTQSLQELNSLAETLEREKANVERMVAQRTRQLTQEQARFLASINGLPLGFIMTDAGNSILNMNPAMRHVLGLKEDLKTPDDVDKQLQSSVTILHELLEKSQECLTTGKLINLPNIEAEGKFYRVFIAPVLLAGSSATKPIGTAILVEDVTEERIMARSKDEFFSIASHELRTPLTAIRGNTSMIEQYYQAQLKDPALHELVGDIHESSVRLIDIVNDFLDASRLEQGKMQITPEDFSIEEVIEDVVYELDNVSRDKSIILRMTNNLGTLPHVHADKNKVKQVVYNLIGNALKFVEKGGVTISVQIEGKYAKVYVNDTGRGISVENQQLLFHKFQQAGTSILTRDTTRGTGLGLYISKLLVEKMGGNIKLEHSEPDKGSSFSFTVPLAK